MKPTFEQVGVGSEKSIVAFQYCKSDFNAPWHFHPQLELTYILESSGTKFIGDYMGTYEPGELVLLQANLPHSWKNQHQKEGNSHSIVIQWNKEIFYPAPELKNMIYMLNKATKGIIFDKQEISSIIPLIKGLVAVHRQQLYIKLLELLILLSEMKFTTLSTSSFRSNLSFEHSNRINKIHDYIEKAYSNKIQLEEVAQIVSMSSQSFSRFFAKMMGRPFFTFLNEYRTNIACKLLLETDQSVTEIAYACGYESLPFFYKQFKKFKKQAPNQFRKQHTR